MRMQRWQHQRVWQWAAHEFIHLINAFKMLIPVLKVFHLSFWLLSEWIEDNLSAVPRRSDDKTYPYLTSHSSLQLNESSIVKLKVPLQVPLKVGSRSRSRSGHGQVMVRSGLTLTPTPTQKWDLSYTLKLVFTTHPPLTTHHTISK